MTAEALPFRVARVQHGLARRRHLRQRHRRFRLRGLRWGFGVQYAVAEPIGEIGGLAAFLLGLRRLALAVARAGRAVHADVEVIVVAPPRPDLRQPGTVALGLAAQRL